MSCINQLPQYMQPSYEALLDLFREVEDELKKQGRVYRVPYAIESVHKQCLHFFFFLINKYSKQLVLKDINTS